MTYRSCAGFSSVEVLMVLIVLGVLLSASYASWQASLRHSSYWISKTQAQAWAERAELLRPILPEAYRGPATGIASYFSPAVTVSPYQTEYQVHLSKQRLAEVGFTIPQAPNQDQRYTYYAQPSPWTQSIIEKILLYQHQLD